MEKQDYQTSSLNFISMLKLIWAHKRFVALFIALSLALVLALSFFMPYKYKTSATVFPPEQGSGSGVSSFLQSMSGVISLGGGIGKVSKSQIFVEILKSREVAEYIVDSTNIAALPQFKDYSRETLYAVAGSFFEPYVNPNGLIVVEAEVPTDWFADSGEKKQTAEFAATAANAAIKGLDYVNRTKNISTARNVRLYIEDMLHDKRNELDSLERALEDFQETHKVLALDKQSQAMLNEAVKIGSNLAEAEVEMQVLLQEYSPQTAVIKAYRKKIKELKEQYERVQSGGLTGADEFSIPLSELPRLARIYAGMMRDRKILEQIVIYLESQRFEEAVREKKDIPTVEVLDEAQVPASQYSPKRKFMLVLSFVLSAFFAVIIVLIYAFAKGRIDLKKEQNVEYYPGSNQNSAAGD